MSKKLDPQFAEGQMIAAGLQPLEPYQNAVSNWRCRCLNCNQIVISRYNRVQQGSGCPRCAAVKVGKRIRLSEEIAISKLREYNLEALEPYVKSDVKWKCKCMLCGDVVFPKLKNLQRGEGGCYKCGMKKAGLKNTMSQEEAFQIVSDAGFEPLEPYKNALAKWKMRHSICGAIVYPKLNSITNVSETSSGCAVCAGYQVQKGFNDLVTTHPELSTQATGWDPSEVTQGSNLKKDWKCSLQHHWSAVVSDRTNKKSGCPYCTGKKVLFGFNDLQTVNPTIGNQAFGWDPTTVTVGSTKRLKWQCNEGHIWKTTVLARSQGYGCPTCAKSGFDPNKESHIYFLHHQDWEMYQIGITNVVEQRINSHEKLGWEVIELRGPMDGLIAREWETSILRMLKSKGADLSNHRIAGKFDGYSEAWSKSTFEVASIKELMRLTEEFESKKET
jgi:Zn finger protein HypA/HybF involved in hydrogenase expression